MLAAMGQAEASWDLRGPPYANESSKSDATSRMTQTAASFPRTCHIVAASIIEVS